jgi:hypothetical protein
MIAATTCNERLVDLIEAYEAKRWPSGKVADGEG